MDPGAVGCIFRLSVGLGASEVHDVSYTFTGLRTMLPLWIAALLCSGCTALQTNPLAPEDLRSEIRSGSLITPGEDVWLVTGDGREHAFKVTEVDAEYVRGRLLGGEAVEVRVDDVVALRTVEDQPVQTLFAGVGILYLALSVILMAEIVDDA